MKHLEDLVPPLELCKKIPVGEFAESVCKWYCDSKDWWIVPREFEVFSADGFPEYPAPTLQEIMTEMGKNLRYYNNLTLEIYPDEYVVFAFIPYKGKPGSTTVEYRDKNGATAALKLFLEPCVR